jgi:hypothetical protein
MTLRPLKRARFSSLSRGLVEMAHGRGSRPVGTAPEEDPMRCVDEPNAMV